MPSMCEARPCLPTLALQEEEGGRKKDRKEGKRRGRREDRKEGWRGKEEGRREREGKKERKTEHFQSSYLTHEGVSLNSHNRAISASTAVSHHPRPSCLPIIF